MNADVIAATTVKSYGYKLNAGHTFKSNIIQLRALFSGKQFKFLPHSCSPLCIRGPLIQSVSLP